MSTKDFNCKHEEVPAIAGVVLSYYLRDFLDFSNFSPEFTELFGEEVNTMRNHCLTMMTSKEVTEQMKSVTKLLPEIIKNIRLQVNKVEGYLNLAEQLLDLPISGFGISALRTEMSDKNIPGIVLQGNTLHTKLVRNQAALTAKGMKVDFLASYKSTLDELDSKKIAQKSKMSERSHTADSNVADFNELWEMTTKILSAAHAIYRGENDLKLKDYTMTHLKKQIRPKTTDDKSAEPTPVVE